MTLPSNSSMSFYPSNTQSHFRTKLSRPISLSGSWEVGLSEILMPRNWFNIGEHNNYYTMSYEEETVVKQNEIEYRIPLTPVGENEDGGNLFDVINENIRKLIPESGVTFVLNEINDEVSVNITENYDLHITTENGEKLLYVLYLPIKDIIISDTMTYRYRPTTSSLENHFFYSYL